LELETQRVWDYVGDNYVHRLIQNKADGKLVELPGPYDNDGDLKIRDETKFEAITLEYNYLLTSQLEKQRTYFEDKFNQLEEDKNKRIKELENMLKEAERNRGALEEQTNLLQIEKKSFDKKYAQLLQKLQKVTKEKDEFEAFTLAHKENPKLWQDKLNEIEQKLKGELASRDKQILELNEQVRDLMFFLEAQKKNRRC